MSEVLVGDTVGSMGVAALGMYPFDEVRWAYEHYWAGVHRRAPWLPESLTWLDDLHTSWVDERLVVGQACGWPLVTQLADRVRVVGAFAPAIPQADGATYRSVLVSRRAGVPADFRGARAAVNSVDSLSGWVSLVHAVHGPGGRWAGDVQWTGAHAASVAAVREGSADVASIDGVTLALLRRHRPTLLAGLVEVGEGPRVPCLPVIAFRAMSDESLAELRNAMVEATIDPEMADVTAAMAVTGFVPLDFADYLPLLDLSPST